jgi:hypothetical protein
MPIVIPKNISNRRTTPVTLVRSFGEETFLSLALQRLWARERNRSGARCVSAASEGPTKAVPPSEASGVAFVAQSRCGSMKSVCTSAKHSYRTELTAWAPADALPKTPSAHRAPPYSHRRHLPPHPLRAGKCNRLIDREL